MLLHPTRFGDVRIEPQQHMQVIIQHRETTDGDCEDVSCGFDRPRPASTHGEHNASRSGTSERGTYRPIERAIVIRDLQRKE